MLQLRLKDHATERPHCQVHASKKPRPLHKSNRLHRDFLEGSQFHKQEVEPECSSKLPQANSFEREYTVLTPSSHVDWSSWKPNKNSGNR